MSNIDSLLPRNAASAASDLRHNTGDRRPHGRRACHARCDPGPRLHRLPGRDQGARRPVLEAAIIHHTDCGSGLLADEELRHGFAHRTGYDEQTLADLPVLDPPATVRTDVERVLSDPRISPHITVSGHVYDVDTGLITTIVEPVLAVAAGVR